MQLVRGQEDGPRPWREADSASRTRAVLGPGQTSGQQDRRGRYGQHAEQASEPPAATDSHLPLAQCGLTHLDHADDLFDGSPEIVHPGRDQKCWKGARRGKGGGRSGFGTGHCGESCPGGLWGLTAGTLAQCSCRCFACDYATVGSQKVRHRDVRLRQRQ